MTPGAEDRIVSLMLGPRTSPSRRRRRGHGRADARRAARELEPARPGHAAHRGARPARRRRSCTDVSFELHAGEVLGVVALEGQGQEELFEVLAGVARGRTAASCAVDGAAGPLRSSGGRHPGGAGVRARRPAGGRCCRSAPCARTSRCRSRRRCAAGAPSTCGRERGRVDGAIERLQIDTRAQSEVRRLSGGNQQKVTIARWIADRRPHAAVLRPDPGHRYPDQAPDLPAAARARRCRRGRAAVHVRAGGGPARLRPGRSSSSAGGWWRRCPPRPPTSRPCCAPPTPCRPDAPSRRQVAEAGRRRDAAHERRTRDRRRPDAPIAGPRAARFVRRNGWVLGAVRAAGRACCSWRASSARTTAPPDLQSLATAVLPRRVRRRGADGRRHLRRHRPLGGRR